jgi:hypothetical protein
MATAIVLVGCYYGYTASGGPVGVGAARRIDGAQHRVRALIGMLGTLVFWGSNPRAPIAAEMEASADDRPAGARLRTASSSSAPPCSCCGPTLPRVSWSLSSLEGC